MSKKYKLIVQLHLCIGKKLYTENNYFFSVFSCIIHLYTYFYILMSQRYYLRVAFFFVFLFFFFNVGGASAATYEVTGWGWGADDNQDQLFCDSIRSNGIPDCVPNGLGWVSFSNKSDQSAFPYGVFINSITGDFTGYAWSMNFGWITYDGLEMQKCATNSGDRCPSGPAPKAHIDVITDSNGFIIGGTGRVTGWARACAVFVSGCSGLLRSNSERGGWDGWISLQGRTAGGASYGLELDTSGGDVMKFKGPLTTGFYAGTPYCPTCYAWSGGSANTGVGWGLNFGGLNVSLISEFGEIALSFWADQTVVYSGQNTILRWKTLGDVDHCTAGGDWSGDKPFTPQQMYITPPLTSDKTYTLQCFSNTASSTPVRVVSILVRDQPLVPVDGVCGTANGSVLKNPPTSNLCTEGSVLDPPGIVFNSMLKQWEWTCMGISGGVNSPLCIAKKKPTLKPVFIEF